MNRVWRVLRSLKLRVLGPEKMEVGVDHLGNKYFRIPKHETWAAWIRKRRKDPPTIEEIFKNEKYREELKRKVDECYEKDRLLQAKEYEEGLVAEPAQIKIKGHASAQHYGRHEPSEDPASIGSTFQPGSWKPPQDPEHKK
ncbi:NADH dehydrogenase [ubiquinone] 1 alpha subcomplex assembly factor 2 isoform X2 [Heteronotia binoei]|uniref:NADH dehydrogenase [ubiquinone] 1 alpha subcomplex assembly factor 2 isoform X2 n=1 Tax=Heteronotia binoei TaxID=13085 RepID=UPI00292FE749|nr:NADH dehydrogenase [ubiquinone] 1 alpha subcomplex assembly factor 2 isoform X2 [Heteronotia binoei]